MKKRSDGFNKSDTKGKLFEILTGSYLMYDQDKPINYLSHYRSFEGRSPEEMHDFLKDKIDTNCSGLYDIVNQHSYEAAGYMKGFFQQEGYNIKEVVWTSQPSDHKSFTGIEDSASDADIMIDTNKGYVGISLKYATKLDTNLRNNGLDTLETITKLEPGELTSIRTNHTVRMKEVYGMSNHEDYKIKRLSTDPIDKKLVSEAIAEALVAQREMASKIKTSLENKYSSEDLREYIGNLISPVTVFPHFRLHTRPSPKGSATHSILDTKSDIEKLNGFETLRVKTNDSLSCTIGIEGVRFGKSEYEPVLVQTIKKISGPLRGFASTTKAPFKTKKVEND